MPTSKEFRVATAAILLAGTLLGSLTVNANDSCKLIFASDTFKNPFVLFERDVVNFVISKGILTAAESQRLVREAKAFQGNNEEMGNAVLLKIIDRLGREPSAAQDQLYNRFYRDIYLSYLDQFELTSRKMKPDTNLRMRPLFGLERLGSGSEIHWNSETASRFVSEARGILGQSHQVDLAKVGEVLIQMTYLNAKLGNDPVADSARVELDSLSYLQMKAGGHRFLPSPGVWTNAQMGAQWFLKSTVVLIPMNFSTANIHHGLSALAGLMHDLNHIYMRRDTALVNHLSDSAIDSKALRSMPFEKRQEVMKFVDQITNSLSQLMTETLIEMRNDQVGHLNGSNLTDAAFIFLHDPKLLKTFLGSMRSGERNWSVDSENVRSFGALIRNTLPKDFEGFVQPTDAFESVARRFVSRLAERSLARNFQLKLSEASRAIR